MKLMAPALLLVAAGIVYSHYYPTYIQPCSQPLKYYLGEFDPRFKMSQGDFLSALSEAESIWEQSSGKNLFQYSPDGGKLAVNLIYDYRQEASDHLAGLGYTIEKTQSSYENLRAYYDKLYASYEQKRSALNSLVAQFDSRKTAYEKEVSYWNQQGGAPKKEADKLNAERDSLTQLAAQIKQQQRAVNSLVNDVNELVPILNSLASQMNLNVTAYNKVGEERGSEFEEGVYRKDDSGESISVYEFTNKDELVRLLAHELGHSLGLEHVEDEESIMYRLNKNQKQTLTAADQAELNRVCAIE